MPEKTKEALTATSTIPKPVQKDSLVLAALGYIIPLAALLVFLISKEDKYAKFHALQALLMYVGFTVAWTVMIILTFISFVTIIGPFILMPLMFIAAFSFYLYSFYCAWRAFKGTEFKIPRVTQIALEHMQ